MTHTKYLQFLFKVRFCCLTFSGVPDVKYNRGSHTDLLLTLALVGRGCNPVIFLKWPPKFWVDRSDILQSLWGIPRATFEKSLNGSVRSQSYDVTSGTISDPFLTKSCFQRLDLFPLTGVESLHNLGQNMSTSDLWHPFKGHPKSVTWPFKGHPNSLTLADSVLSFGG